MARFFQALRIIAGKSLKPLTTFVFGLQLTTAVANEQVTLGIPEITGNLTPTFSSGGLYDQFFSHLPDTDVVVAPYARLDRLFIAEQVDCLFPQSEASLQFKGKQILTSDVVMTVSAFAFSRQDYSTLDSLQHKRIAVRRGMTLGGIRETLEATYVELDNDEALRVFLEKDRIDAFISYLPDITALYEASSEPMPYYNEAHPVATTSEFIVCHDTTATRAFINATNEAIAEHLTHRH